VLFVNTRDKHKSKSYHQLATNVTYEVLTKCCYFLNRSQIKYGHPGLGLTGAFWISSQERLKGFAPNLPQMLLMSFRQSVSTFF